MSAERGVIYRRQSADRNNDELGIGRQLKVCQHVATSRRIEVVRVITDNSLSASKRDSRPGYFDLLDLMKSGEVDVVLILRIDRLMRLNDELEDLIKLVEQYPVRVVTAEGDIDLSTPQGRLLARILVSVARNEIEVKSARQKLANQQRAAQGLSYASWRPFGYEDDRVSIRESEAAVLRDMASRVLNGHSYREIATRLNERGIPTARGNKWYPRGVRQQLQFKRYAGIREYEGVDYQAAWPAIFDAETWERLQLTMRLKTAALAPDRPRARKYLLTGLLFCGVCGGAMNGTTKRDRPDRPLRRTYYCRCPGDRKNHGCGKVQRGAPALEHFVSECVLTRLDTPRLAGLMQRTADGAQLRGLLSHRELLQSRLDGFTDDYATGLLTKAEFTRAKTTASQELDRLNRELLAAAGSRPTVNVPLGATIRKAWETAESDSWRRSVLGLLVDRIVVNPCSAKPWYVAGERRYRFDPSAIDVFWLA